MLRRTLRTLPLAAGLLALSGCLCFDQPLFPRLRSLLPGSNGGCPPGAICDVGGPILDTGEPLDSYPVNSKPAIEEGTMPQPRLVPQPLTTPEAEPMPYKPAKNSKK